MPSGFFVPCILMGCSMGRFTGELINIIFTHYGILNVEPGTYAFIGAASVLGISLKG